ncbi:hypothetical protein GCM10010174_16700 [Kutzneria viridogrisea]|uniref:Uncharacterized protein n=1 Tax=Kutzneria viridogrisea TaxID=47990 RepID=A0ABR6BDR5_9PSEU|nr:hypothetical protein [Kutzneria viridogrisea]
MTALDRRHAMKVPFLAPNASNSTFMACPAPHHAAKVPFAALNAVKATFTPRPTPEDPA